MFELVLGCVQMVNCLEPGFLLPQRACFRSFARTLISKRTMNIRFANVTKCESSFSERSIELRRPRAEENQEDTSFIAQAHLFSGNLEQLLEHRWKK